jgi:hypothetical protein
MRSALRQLPSKKDASAQGRSVRRVAGSSPVRASTDDSDVIPPPSTMTVDDRRAVLFDSQNRPLVRRIGF